MTAEERIAVILGKRENDLNVARDDLAAERGTLHHILGTKKAQWISYERERRAILRR